MNQRTIKAAAKFPGAILEDTGEAITCLAPLGYVWAGTGLHEVVHAYGPGSWGHSKTSAQLAVVGDLELGVEVCPDRRWTDVEHRGCDMCDDVKPDHLAQKCPLLWPGYLPAKYLP